MTIPTYIGIDPGRHGCIAAISPQKDTHPAIHLCRLNECSRYGVIDWLRRFDRIGNYGDYPHIAIEKITSSPQMGVRSAFTFGQSFGWLEGIIQALNYSHVYVRPQTWKKDLQISPRKEQTQAEHKRVLVDFAWALFPNETMTPDVADALLIAHWCQHIRAVEGR